MGFFSFPSVSRLNMATTIVTSSLLGMMCYSCAFRIHFTKMAELTAAEKKTILKRELLNHQKHRQQKHIEKSVLSDKTEKTEADMHDRDNRIVFESRYLNRDKHGISSLDNSDTMTF